MKNGQPNLLCVEDDPADREALRDYVDILGWNASFSTSGIQGHARAMQTRFDVIVTDQNMPGLTGLGLVACLRHGKGPNARTPVLLNTQLLTPDVLERAQQLQIEAVVEKPLMLTSFKERIHRLLRRRSAADQAMRGLGTLSVYIRDRSPWGRDAANWDGFDSSKADRAGSLSGLFDGATSFQRRHLFGG